MLSSHWPPHSGSLHHCWCSAPVARCSALQRVFSPPFRFLVVAVNLRLVSHLSTLGVQTHSKLKDGHVPNATIQAVCSILGAVFQELECLDGCQQCVQVIVAPLQEAPGHNWVPDKIGRALQLASVYQVP